MTEFIPAKIRRRYIRGKRADRRAAFNYFSRLYILTLDQLWTDVLSNDHPFLDRFIGPPIADPVWMYVPNVWYNSTVKSGHRRTNESREVSPSVGHNATLDGSTSTLV